MWDEGKERNGGLLLPPGAGDVSVSQQLLLLKPRAELQSHNTTAARQTDVETDQSEERVHQDQPIRITLSSQNCDAYTRTEERRVGKE